MNSQAHLAVGYMHSDWPESSLVTLTSSLMFTLAIVEVGERKKKGLSGLTLIMG